MIENKFDYNSEIQKHYSDANTEDSLFQHLENFVKFDNELPLIFYRYQNATKTDTIPSDKINEDGTLKDVNGTPTFYLSTVHNPQLKTDLQSDSCWHFILKFDNLKEITGIDAIEYKIPNNPSYRFYNKVARTVSNIVEEEVLTACKTYYGTQVSEKDTNIHNFYKSFDGKVIQWGGNEGIIWKSSDIPTDKARIVHTTPDSKIVDGVGIMPATGYLKRGHYYKITVKEFGHFFESQTSTLGQYVKGIVLCFDEVPAPDFDSMYEAIK